MLIIYILILLSVAFFTLSERKILSYSQLRLGPNKTMYYGMIQPILDGIKLLKKFNLNSFKTHKILFKIMSFLILMILMFMWFIIPFNCWSNKSVMMLFIILVFGISSYMILILSWSSLNNYSIMGGNRSLAQVLSFEMIMTLLIMMMFVMKYKMSNKFSNYYSFFLFLLMFICYILSIFIEVHRAPLDLAEGESELVSGYNTEFSSLYFVMIFLSEYLSLLLMIILAFTIWLYINFMWFVILMSITIMVRSCFPRIRYDQVMELVWIKIMPFLILLWLMYLKM